MYEAVGPPCMPCMPRPSGKRADMAPAHRLLGKLDMLTGDQMGFVHDSDVLKGC